MVFVWQFSFFFLLSVFILLKNTNFLPKTNPLILSEAFLFLKPSCVVQPIYLLLSSSQYLLDSYRLLFLFQYFLWTTGSLSLVEELQLSDFDPKTELLGIPCIQLPPQNGGLRRWLPEIRAVNLGCLKRRLCQCECRHPTPSGTELGALGLHLGNGTLSSCVTKGWSGCLVVNVVVHRF